MKFNKINYECIDCDHKFFSPIIGGGNSVYGEFIMHSKKGQVAYLYAIDDKVFKEFSSMLKENESLLGFDTCEILHDTFGWTCDSAPDGTLYQITEGPSCPKCLSKRVWRADYDLPKVVELDLPSITHNRWNLLSKTEKEKVMSEALSSLKLEEYRLYQNSDEFESIPEMTFKKKIIRDIKNFFGYF